MICFGRLTRFTAASCCEVRLAQTDMQHCPPVVKFGNIHLMHHFVDKVCEHSGSEIMIWAEKEPNSPRFLKDLQTLRDANNFRKLIINNYTLH